MKVSLTSLLLIASCAHQTASNAPPLSESEKQQAKKLLEVAEVPESQLDTDAKRRLVRITSEQKCPCSEAGGTLAECAVQKGACVRAPFAVRRVARGLTRDEKEQAITTALLERFGPREPEEIKLQDIPCRGSKEAPVTMVVFSDFQCPFCSMGAKLVEKLEEVAGERLRVCFKHWPLTSIHPKAQLAAQAAAAAQAQGKFWPMHDRLYANQNDLDRDDLIDHARAVGLDVERFRRDLDSEAVRKRVESDTADAQALNLDGTPTFLINGRRMTDPKTIPDFLDWIAEALALKKLEKKQQPSSQPAG
jgi:predicted DsbA family dithiol-disulfide isomerase